jgi:Dynamin family
VGADTTDGRRPGSASPALGAPEAPAWRPPSRPAKAAARSSPPARPAPADAPADGVQLAAPADLRRACELLRELVALLALPLDVPRADEARRELAALTTQLDDYLLPRLRRIDAPLLAVVGGSTGAGKSTLVNSLVRRVVTRSGVLRPTTRSPVLIHHPYDSGAFLTQRILPGFARVTSEAPEPLQPIDVHAPRATALRLVPDEGLAPGLAVIDAPDIDSLVETNRELAQQLLAAADLWIFVTTAARYSDAVPWDTLRTAVDRGVSVAVVLDRVPAEAMAEVRVHLATMLRDRGLSTAPLFTVPESVKDADGFLPDDVVRPIHGWLSRLARDSRARDVVVRRTLVGALDSLHERVRLLTVAAEDQAAAHARLREGVADAFDGAGARLEQGLHDGGLLEGEVQARWQEYVGSGEAFRGFDGTLGRLRDRVTAAVRGHAAPSAPLAVALRSAVGALVVTTGEAAVQDVAGRWRADVAGRALLDHVPGGHAVSRNFAMHARQIADDWYGGVQGVIRAETQGGRPNARAVAFGVDGLAALLTVLALGEHAGAGRSAAAAMSGVAHRLLHSVLGGDPAPLAAAAREALHSRIGDLLAAERHRFDAALDGVAVRDDLPGALRDQLHAIEGAR